MPFFRDKPAYIRRQDDHFQEFESLGVCNNTRLSSGLSHAVQMLTPEDSVRKSAVPASTFLRKGKSPSSYQVHPQIQLYRYVWDGVIQLTLPRKMAAQQAISCSAFGNSRNFEMKSYWTENAIFECRTNGSEPCMPCFASLDDISRLVFFKMCTLCQNDKPGGSTCPRASMSAEVTAGWPCTAEMNSQTS